jgi:hypothetical protein
MKQIRKSPVVLSLVGIFFFPIFFQAFHVFTHHRHPEINCCEHSHWEFPVKFKQADPVCPVLAYEFASMDLIMLWQIPQHSPALKTIFLSKYQNPDKQTFYCSNALRAPPAIPIYTS